MFRLKAIPYFALILMGMILLPLAVQASEPMQPKQASFEGTVLEVIPCTNISGSLVTVGSSSAQFIYREGISKSAPTNIAPTLGKQVSGVLFPAFIECTVVNGDQTTTVKRQSILYYASARVNAQPSQVMPTIPSNQSFGGSSNSSSFGGFSSLFSKLQGSFSSLFSGSSGQTSSSGASSHTGSNTNGGISNVGTNEGTSAGAVSTGGFSINQPYGGIVLAAIPCTCSAGDFMITLGPPSAGTYLFSPTSVPTIYPYGMVIVPGVHHLGFYRPFGFCKMVGTPCVVIPMTRGTITSVGTSLPGR